MNWDRIQDRWLQLKGKLTRRWARQARERQMAEWLARQHQVDRIYK